MKVGVLNGKKVISSDAQVLGEAEDTDISVDTWTVTHIHVSLTKEISEGFNFEKPFLGSVTVCLPVNTIEAVGEVIVLNKSIKELRGMKEFKIQKE